MNLAKIVSELISNNLKNGDGTPVECVIADGTIGRVGESAACAEKFERAGVGATITVLLLVLRYRDYGHASHHPKRCGDSMVPSGQVRIPCSGIGCTRAEGTSRFRYLRRDIQDISDNSIPSDVQEKLLRFARVQAVATMRGRSTSPLAVSLWVLRDRWLIDFFQVPGNAYRIGRLCRDFASH